MCLCTYVCTYVCKVHRYTLLWFLIKYWYQLLTKHKKFVLESNTVYVNLQLQGADVQLWKKRPVQKGEHYAGWTRNTDTVSVMCNDLYCYTLCDSDKGSNTQKKSCTLLPEFNYC